MILLHINDKSKEQRILRLCSAMKLPARRLSEKDAVKSVGLLAGLKTDKRAGGNGGAAASADKHVAAAPAPVSAYVPAPASASKSVSAVKPITVPALYTLPDCIIFAGVADKVMDDFLARYKSNGIEPTGLKAVVTIHNMNWSLYELLEELKKERTAIYMRGR